jgi:hypothetical protein
LIYVDASAIITLIAGSRQASELRDFLAAKPTMPMGTSTLGFVETVRTLDQIGDYPGVMADLVAGFTEILVTEEVRDATARLPNRVRTLDAVHIASAQILDDALADHLRQADVRRRPVRRPAGGRSRCQLTRLRHLNYHGDAGIGPRLNRSAAGAATITGRPPGPLGASAACPAIAGAGGVPQAGRQAGRPAVDATGYVQAAGLFRRVALAGEEDLIVPAYQHIP